MSTLHAKGPSFDTSREETVAPQPSASGEGARRPGLAADSVARRALAALPLLILGIVILRAAWMADDAYITLRVVDNFWNGYGLRWNVVERVQVFTHPLWMMLLAAAYGLTREAYFTTLVLSAGCLALTLHLLNKRLSRARGILFVLMLAMSRAFVDYSTSGLENPLSHLLLVSYCLVCLLDERSASRLNTMAWLAAACLLTRLDLGILVLPSLCAEACREGLARSWKPLLFAALPVAIWHLFTLAYYGSFAPNTAYAKLSTGVAASQLVWQGLLYLRESLLADFVTLPAILLGAGLALASRRHRDRALWVAAGIVATMLYVMAIGGDFMSGRFLTAPFITALCLIVLAVRRSPAMVVVGALACVGGLLSPRSPLHVWLNEDDRPWSVRIADPATHGIVDERRVYYWATGLLNVATGKARPGDHPWAAQGLVLSGLPHVRVREAVGLVGYYGGPSLHIIDPMALTDAFLARQPVSRLQGWSIGHFTRDLPTGYQTAVERCMLLRYSDGRFDPASRSTCLDFEDVARSIADLHQRALYRDVMLATQGPILSAGRWRAIVRLNR